MEFQQKKLETEKTTQNIYRLFSTKTMKSKNKFSANDETLNEVFQKRYIFCYKLKLRAKENAPSFIY